MGWNPIKEISNAVSSSGASSIIDPGGFLFKQPNVANDQFSAYAEQMKNRDLSGELYGQSLADTGKDVQEIKDRYKERTTSEFAKSQAAKDSQNRYRQLAQSLGRNSGAMQTAAAKDQIYRQQLEKETQNRLASLNDYKSIVGNIMSGQGQLEMGQMGLNIAGQEVTPQAGFLENIFNSPNKVMGMLGGK